jgi:hypothetical protein
VVEAAASEVSTRLEPVDYDAERVAHELVEAGLPAEYGDNPLHAG